MTKLRPLIAVIDDEHSVRTALERLIRSAGMDVEIYPSGEDFLQAMRTRQPDCVVLDLHMPGMNGFETQARLAHAGMRIPVVTITGHDTPESNARALKAGAAAYLLKPVDDRVLMAAIAEAIAKES